MSERRADPLREAAAWALGISPDLIAAVIETFEFTLPAAPRAR